MAGFEVDQHSGEGRLLELCGEIVVVIDIAEMVVIVKQ